MFLRGDIRDAQERYNLRNLVDPATRQLVAAEVEALSRLCDAAGVAPEAAQTLAAGLQAAWTAEKQEAAEESSALAVLAPQNVDQLAWLGLDADTVERLRPYVELLPEPTPLNINTIGRGAGRRHRRSGPGQRPAHGQPAPVQGAGRRAQRVRGRRRWTRNGSAWAPAISRSPAGCAARPGDRERLLVQRQDRELIPLARSRQSLQPVVQ